MRYVQTDLSDMRDVYQHIMKILMFLTNARNAMRNTAEAADACRLIEINTVICEINSYMKSNDNSAIKEEMLKAYYAINSIIKEIVIHGTTSNYKSIFEYLRMLSIADDAVHCAKQLVEIRINGE